MPLYEYRCPACHHRFEVLQNLGASATEASCPTCGATPVERCLSTFAVSSSTASSANSGMAGCADTGGGCALPQCGGGSCAGDWN